MASLLDSYEQQYGIITASITAKTAKLSSATLGNRFQLFQFISVQILTTCSILNAQGKIDELSFNT